MVRVLALLLVLVVAGCGSGRTTRSAGGPVPWVNQPRPRYELPPPQIVRYAAGAPLCRAARLRVRQGRTGAATGNLLEELVFTNTGVRACLLRGYPTVTADTPTGRRVLHPRHGTFFGELVPADLEPGGHVFLDFGTSDCGCRCESAGGVRYGNLVFTLPQGGQVDGRGVTITNGCHLDMSAFGLPERVAQSQAKPGTPGTLSASVRLPATARRGAILRYVLTLTNPTGATVLLTPCPAYTEFLGNAGGSVQRSYALSCGSIRAIPPHGHVAYEMEVEVPAKALTGPAKLAWQLGTPTGPSTAGVVQLVGG